MEDELSNHWTGFSFWVSIEVSGKIIRLVKLVKSEIRELERFVLTFTSHNEELVDPSDMAQVKQVKVQLLKSSKKQEVLIATVTLVMGLTHLMQLSALPFGAYNNGLSRRSDDDDELDSRASVHSGNQDGPNNGDGYEEADNGKFT